MTQDDKLRELREWVEILVLPGRIRGDDAWCMKDLVTRKIDKLLAREPAAAAPQFDNDDSGCDHEWESYKGGKVQCCMKCDRFYLVDDKPAPEDWVHGEGGWLKPAPAATTTPEASSDRDFTCPKCGGHDWGSYCYGDFDEMLGHCHSCYKFSWPRTEDAKYLRDEPEASSDEAEHNMGEVDGLATKPARQLAIEVLDLRAEVERLRAALEAAAHFWHQWDQGFTGDDMEPPSRRLKNALDALGEEKGDD